MDKLFVRIFAVKSLAAKTLFANIAPEPAPPTNTLVQEHVNRMTMNQRAFINLL